MKPRRKPLPYAALSLIDDALMALSAARRYMKPLLDKTDLETVARTGRALDEIHHASESLVEVRSLRPEDSNG
jgi:hypothetical protein